MMKGTKMPGDAPSGASDSERRSLRQEFTPRTILDFLVRTGMRVKFESTGDRHIHWALLKGIQCPGMDHVSLDPSTGNALEYWEEGTARNFGEAIIQLGEAAARYNPRSWFAELWGMVTPDDKKRWAIAP